MSPLQKKLERLIWVLMSQVEVNTLRLIDPLPFVQTANSLWIRELFSEESNTTLRRKTFHLGKAEQEEKPLIKAAYSWSLL